MTNMVPYDPQTWQSHTDESDFVECIIDSYEEIKGHKDSTTSISDCALLAITLGMETPPHPDLEDQTLSQLNDLIKQCLSSQEEDKSPCTSLWRKYAELVDIPHYDIEEAHAIYVLTKYQEPWRLEADCKHDEITELIENEEHGCRHFGGRWEVIGAIILEWALENDEYKPQLREEIMNTLNSFYEKGKMDLTPQLRLREFILNSIVDWPAIYRGHIVVDDFIYSMYDILNFKGKSEDYHSMVIFRTSSSIDFGHTLKPGKRTTLSISGINFRRSNNSKPPFPVTLDSSLFNSRD